MFWACVTVFIILMPFVILYALGYRIDKSFALRKTGGLYVASDITNSSIYIDGKLVRTTNLLQDAAFVDSLSPGSYEISISAAGYLPWKKNLEVRSQLVTEARALLIPEKDNVQVLVTGNFVDLHSSSLNNLLIFAEEKNSSPAKAGEKIVRWYASDAKEFLTDTGALIKYQKNIEVVRWLPQGVVLKLDGKTIKIRFNLDQKTASLENIGTEPTEKTMEEIMQENIRKDEQETVAIELFDKNKAVKATWIKNDILPYYFKSKEEVLISDKDIKNFDFFPGRRDAIIAAHDNTVSSIEIDSRGNRIVQTLYKGKDPNFAIAPGKNLIYILDAGNLISLKTSLED